MKHLIIPDTQVKPGTPINHLGWAGQYAVDKKPDDVEETAVDADIKENVRPIIDENMNV